MQVNITVHHLLLTVEYFSVFKLFFLYYGHFRSYFFDHAITNRKLYGSCAMLVLLYKTLLNVI